MSIILRLLCAVLMVVFLANTAGTLHTVSAQTITQFEKVEDYDLPYPGLLPDNPLYVLKTMRDSVQLMLAGTPLEKAKVYLQLADKNVASAVELTRKGKHTLAVERVHKAQNLTTKAISAVEKEKESMNEDERKQFIELIKKSNLKHRETIEMLMKEAPTGQVEALDKLRQENSTLRAERIEKLK